MRRMNHSAAHHIVKIGFNASRGVCVRRIVWLEVGKCDASLKDAAHHRGPKGYGATHQYWVRRIMTCFVVLQSCE